MWDLLQYDLAEKRLPCSRKIYVDEDKSEKQGSIIITKYIYTEKERYDKVILSYSEKFLQVYYYENFTHAE